MTSKRDEHNKTDLEKAKSDYKTSRKDLWFVKTELHSMHKEAKDAETRFETLKKVLEEHSDGLSHDDLNPMLEGLPGINMQFWKKVEEMLHSGKVMQTICQELADHLKDVKERVEIELKCAKQALNAVDEVELRKSNADELWKAVKVAKNAIQSAKQNKYVGKRVEDTLDESMS